MGGLRREKSVGHGDEMLGPCRRCTDASSRAPISSRRNDPEKNAGRTRRAACYVAMQLPAEGATAGDAPKITCTDPLSGTVHETVVGVVAPGAKPMT